MSAYPSQVLKKVARLRTTYHAKCIHKLVVSF